MTSVQMRRWCSVSYETDLQCISNIPGGPRGNLWECLPVLSAKQELSRQWWLSTRWTVQSLSLTKCSFPYLGKLTLRPQDKQSNLHVGEAPANKNGVSDRLGTVWTKIGCLELKWEWACHATSRQPRILGHLYLEGLMLCIFCRKLSAVF